MTECYNSTSLLSQFLLKCLAISIDLRPDYFTDLHNKLDHTMELKHYQPLIKNESVGYQNFSFV